MNHSYIFLLPKGVTHEHNSTDEVFYENNAKISIDLSRRIDLKSVQTICMFIRINTKKALFYTRKNPYKYLYKKRGFE